MKGRSGPTSTVPRNPDDSLVIEVRGIRGKPRRCRLIIAIKIAGVVTQALDKTDISESEVYSALAEWAAAKQAEYALAQAERAEAER